MQVSAIETKFEGDENSGWTNAVNKTAKKESNMRILPKAIVMSCDLNGNIIFKLKKSSLGKTVDFRNQAKNSLEENVTTPVPLRSIYSARISTK